MTSTQQLDKDREALREDIDYWVCVSGMATSGADLHLPAHKDDTPKPLCGYAADSCGCRFNSPAEWIQKPVNVYPLGYSDICDACYQMWNGEKPQGMTESYCAKALNRVIDEKEGDLLTRDEYEELRTDDEPHAGTVAKYLTERGTWHKVRVRFDL